MSAKVMGKEVKKKMALTKLKSVRSYFEPEVFEAMEKIRTSNPRFRRTTRSKFVEDCVLACIERIRQDAEPGRFEPRDF
jgi:hypothetical protein